MVEPISDDELQRLRELWKYLQGFDPDYRISERVGPLLRLLARLDAAESRPSAESVQAAIANAQFILDGDGVLPAYRQLLIDMIAGLTGGEG